MFANIIHNHSSSIVVALCGLTSLSTIGYIFIDSKECNQKRNKMHYEQMIHKLQLENDNLKQKLKHIQKQQI